MMFQAKKHQSSINTINGGYARFRLLQLFVINKISVKVTNVSIMMVPLRCIFMTLLQKFTRKPKNNSRVTRFPRKKYA